MSNRMSIRCSWCEDGTVSSLEELKAHIAWEHLSYTPYQCIYCQNVNRPTDVALKLHFQESHPGKPIKMMYSPNDEMEAVLQFEISESLRQTTEKQNPQSSSIPRQSESAIFSRTLVSYQLNNGRFSPTSSSGSGCSRTSESDMNVPGDSTSYDQVFGNCSKELVRPTETETTTDVIVTQQESSLLVESTEQGPALKLLPKIPQETVRSLVGIEEQSPEENLVEKTLENSTENIEATPENFKSVDDTLPPAPAADLSKNSDRSFLMEVTPQSAVSSVRFPFKRNSMTTRKPFQGAKSMRVCLISGKYELSPTQVLCRLCCGTVKASKVFRHVLRTHSEENSLRCKHCGLENKYDRDALKEHSKQEHPNQDEDIEDLRPKFGSKIQDLLRHCFPNSPAAELKSHELKGNKGQLVEHPKTENLKTGVIDSDLQPMEFQPSEHTALTVDIAPSFSDSAGARLTESCWTANQQEEELIQKLDENLVTSAVTALMENTKVLHQLSGTAVPRNTTTKRWLTENITSQAERNWPSREPEPLVLSTGKIPSTCSERGGLVSCGICRASVEMGSRSLNLHVVECHLKRPLYFCPYCSKTEFINFYRMNEHIGKVHSQKKLQVLSTEEKNREQLYQLGMLCFGKHINSGVGRKRTVPVIQIQGDDVLAEKEMLIPNDSNKERSVTQSAESSDWGSDFGETTSPSAFHCSLCSASVQSSSRHAHVVVYHLKKQLFYCPYCEARDWVGSRYLRTHVRKWHPDEEQVVLSIAEYYKEKLAGLREMCFGAVVVREIDEKSCCDVRQVTEEQLPLQKVSFESTQEVGPVYSDISDDENRDNVDSDVSDEILGPAPVPFVSLISKDAAPRKMTKDSPVESVVQGFPRKPMENCRSRKTGAGNMMITCQVCDVTFRNHKFNRLRHILQHHIETKMFSCGHCGYTSKDSSNCYKHVKGVHSSSKMLNRTGEYSEEIESWQWRCFGIGNNGRKMESQNTREEMMHVKMELGEGSSIKSAAEMNTPTISSRQQFMEVNDVDLANFDKVGETGIQVAKSQQYFTPRGPKKCHLCDGKIVSGKALRHLLAFHLRKFVYFCGYCGQGTVCQPTNVRAHIEKKHPDKPIKILDLTNREPIRSQIEDLKRQCFSPQGKRPKVKQEQEDNDASISGLFNSLTQPLLKESQSGKIEAKKEGQAKVKGRIRCSLCPKDIAKYQWLDTRNLREQHVLLAHLKKKLYSCSLCAFRDCSKKGNVRKHIAKCHPGQEVEIGSQYQLYKEEIDKLMTECFAKRRKRITNNALNALNVLKEFAKQKKERLEESKMCKECQREISVENLEKHIYEIHLKEKCVECPYCDFAVLFDPEQVRFHIPVFHPEKEPEKVNDRRMEPELRHKFEKIKKTLLE